MSFNDDFWNKLLGQEGRPAMVDGVRVWISPQQREHWHALMHGGVLFEECEVCHDDLTLMEEMEQTAEEDAEEPLFDDEEDEDE